MCSIASRSSVSLDPNWRKIVTSFTPAASAIRLVVEPLKPCCAKTSAAAARISCLRVIPAILHSARPECKQLLAYTIDYAIPFYRVRMDQIARVQLDKAFDAALAQVQLLIATRMKAVDGTSAVPQLEALATELRRERVNALERGTVDREWIQKTVRSVVEWVPDTKLTLIAALGRIVRAKSPA